MPTYDIYVEVNKTNIEKVCGTVINSTAPYRPTNSKTIDYYQYTNYPFVSKHSGKESGCSQKGHGCIPYYFCNATSYSQGQTGSSWPIQNAYNQGTSSQKGIKGLFVSYAPETNFNSIPPWYVDSSGSGNFNVGAGFSNFATPLIPNPTSGLYNFSNFVKYSTNVQATGPVSLNSLFTTAFGNTADNYITSWYNVFLNNTKMLGYCPVEKPGGSYHGTAYNILTQTFQTSGTPPDTSACTASQYNTITSDNNVMPSDYNMVKGNGLNIGPFASVFDPGSQLAGGTVYNSETSSAAALCSRASSQCEYFNNPGVNNYCPYSSGTGNYTPQCHFHNGAAAGDYGNCNACALCEFTLSIPYYPLQEYSQSPNVNSGIYTPPNFSSDNVFSYYNVSPLSTTPKAFLHPGMDNFPNIIDVVAPDGASVVQDTRTGIPTSGWNFDTAEIKYKSTSDSKISDYIQNGMNTYGVYGVYKLTYTLSDSDYTDDLEYKIRDFLALQQWLLPEYSPWFTKTSSYWSDSLQSMKQMVVDYCNKTKNMTSNLCSSQNLAFDFLQSSPCIDDTTTCMNGWTGYCNTSDNFFSDTCLNVYQKSYVDGEMVPDIQNLLNTKCSAYANSTNDNNLSSDFLRVCGCYLPSNYYNDVFESNSELADSVGGYNYRQCWYLPCIYSNLPPVNPTKMVCENNNISNCIQTTVANYTDMSGTLADNNIAVNSYLNNCGATPTPDVQISVNENVTQPSEIMTTSPIPAQRTFALGTPSSTSSSSVIQSRKNIFDMSFPSKVFLFVLTGLVIGAFFVFLGEKYKGKLQI